MILSRVHHVIDMAEYRAVTVIHFLPLLPAITHYCPAQSPSFSISKHLSDNLSSPPSREAKVFVWKAKRGWPARKHYVLRDISKGSGLHE